ncbi:SEL1-like repeat protein [Candidatus Dependentiae bacterium]|nr:SEL1-like repeat protein [Candidatus Dependentiae bacterium]
MESKVELIQRTKNAIKEDLSNQDLQNFSLAGCNAKSCNFTQTLLGIIDPTQTDFYNACFIRAKIENKNELKESSPLFNVLGRIDSIKDGNQCIEGKNISFTEEINSHYQARAKEGDPIGLFMLAYLYETYGTREQEETACSLYLKSATKGTVEAYNNVGWMYENKRGTSDKSSEKAWEYYKKASAHPKGNFNMTRLTALAFKDAPAQYAVGQLYYNGQGVQCDPEMAFYWYLKAAHQHYSPAMFKVGCFLKNGIGIKKSLPQALEWLLKVPSKDSYLQLGRIYYYGEGTAKDLQKSFYYRNKAVEMGDRDALGEIAWMYEKGEGTERDIEKALECYTLLAQSTNEINALYEQARMHDLLGHYQQAVKLYEYTNAQSVVRENQAHHNALYRLALKHEKGIGTPLNHGKALDLFKQTAKAGHMLSQLKLKFIERASGDDAALFNFDSIIDMKPAVALYYVQESKRVQEEVMKNYKIVSQQTFRNDERGNPQLVNLNEQVWYTIKQDYLAARKVLKKTQEERQEDPLIINYEFITCDPYIKYYFIDLTKDISDAEVSDQSLIKLFQEMQNAVRTIPSYTSDVIIQLALLKTKFLNEPQKIHLRKRFLGRYRIWTDKTHPQCLSVEDLIRDPLQNRRGQSAILFGQNSHRCLDGFSIYLDDQDAKDMSETHIQLPLGARISKILNHYKENFLLKHKNTSPERIEESVEAMVLLKERMRLPLGLVGTFGPMLYPQLGKGKSPIYQPKKVMERFMKGGTIPERLGIVIEPYTPELLVKLLKEEVSKDNGLLGTPHLNLFTENDQYLKALCENALDNEENDYFDPNADGQGFFKDALYIKLLLDHGYIVKQ